MRLHRSWRVWLLAGFLLPAIGLVYGLWLAQSRPIERKLELRLPYWPAGAAPVRIVLATDIHVSNLARARDRATAVVAQINALRPDVILLGGDYVGGHVQAHAEQILPALAPLKQLKAPLGVYAVLGNHDHWADVAVVRRALNRAGIRILMNSAATAGPLVIGGVDDQFTRHARLNPTEASMRRRRGIPIMLAHSPDVFALERIPVPLTLAGHTHCGQIALPFFGPIVVPTRLGRRYSCGVIEQAGRTLIVSGGIGTSQVPIRLFAPPDLWVVDLGPG